MGAGTLYALLDRFEKDGLIDRTRTEEARKYYCLTPEGEHALHQEYERLRRPGRGYGAGAERGGRAVKRSWSLFAYPVMDIKAAEAALNRRATVGWRLEKVWLGLLASFVPARRASPILRGLVRPQPGGPELPCPMRGGRLDLAPADCLPEHL